jgi:Icc protein
VAVVAACLKGMGANIVSPRTTEYPRPCRTILHFSDTHLLAGDQQLFGTVSPTGNLDRVLAAAARSDAKPDAVVFTGDLADRGEPEAYAALRHLVAPVVEDMGAGLIWLVGNHDSRAHFREHLLGAYPTTEPVVAVHDLDGLRVIALDSTVPGHHHGEIGPEQLNWLADVLSEPAPLGTILALHHPPLPSPLLTAATVELHNQHELAAVLAGTDVRSIIAGHLHHSASGMFAGIPVSVASATCYTQDLTTPVGGSQPVNAAQTYNLIHVYPTTIVHSVVPVTGAEALETTSATQALRILNRAGISLRRN